MKTGVMKGVAVLVGCTTVSFAQAPIVEVRSTNDLGFLERLAPNDRTIFIGRVLSRTHRLWSQDETVTLKVEESLVGELTWMKQVPNTLKVNGQFPDLVIGERYFIFAQALDNVIAIVPLEQDDSALVAKLRRWVEDDTNRELALSETVRAVLAKLLPPWKTVWVYQRDRPYYREYPFFKGSFEGSDYYSVIYGAVYARRMPCLVFDPITIADRTTVTGTVLPDGEAFSMTLVHTNGGFFPLTNRVSITGREKLKETSPPVTD